MSSKKRKLIGVLLITAGIVIAGYVVYQYFFAEEPNYSVEAEQEIEVEDLEEEQEPVPFELKNISEEILDMLQIDEQDLADMIQEWTACNGEYKSAVGVEFYEIDKALCTPEKSTIMMKTIVGEGHQEEERRILMLDYYKELDQYNIHP